MKNIFILAIVILALFAECSQTDHYRIQGNIQGVKDGWVWMKQKTETGYRILDSAWIKQGQFEFEGNLPNGIQSVNLYVDNVRGTLYVFLEPGKIQIRAKRDSIYYAFVTGTPNNERWGNYVREESRLYALETEASRAYQQSFATKNRDSIKAAERAFSDAIQAREHLKTDFLSAPENRYVAACWYRANKIHRMQYHAIDSLIKAMGTGMEKNNDYCLMLARREMLKKQVLGAPFGEVVLCDVNGDERSLSALRGHWVLVDFWASWCGPCRREGKHVLDLYKKYHKQGFEVFGISIDRNLDAWKQVIAEDQTPWIHVCDVDGKIAAQYGITVIPHTFLIDPEGKIAAVNITGESLDRQLQAIFQ